MDVYGLGTRIQELGIGVGDPPPGVACRNVPPPLGERS